MRSLGLLLIWNYLTNAVTAGEDSNVPPTNFQARDYVSSKFGMKFGSLPKVKTLN